MCKKLAIFLISVHLLGNTECGQLLRIPQLIHHYAAHKASNPGLSFMGFINEHYILGDDGTDQDNDQDQQLPCHNLQHTTTVFVYDFQLPQVAENKQYESLAESDFSLYRIPGIKQPEQQVILQPPKFS